MIQKDYTRASAKLAPLSTSAISSVAAIAAIALSAAVSANAAPLFQTDFTEASLGDAGFTTGPRNGGDWILNDPQNRAEFDVANNTGTAGLNSTSGFSSDAGFDVEVVFFGKNTSNNRALHIGLVDAAEGFLDNRNASQYSIFLEVFSGSTDNFRFDNGTTDQVLSTAQAYTSDTEQTLNFTISSSGAWSYSLNGATATTGTIVGGFDTTRDYRFWAGTGSQSTVAGTYISSVVVSAIPEPSSYGLLSGLLALGWIMIRRR